MIWIGIGNAKKMQGDISPCLFFAFPIPNHTSNLSESQKRFANFGSFYLVLLGIHTTHQAG